jgi:AraC-like DNA-binding protein
MDALSEVISYLKPQAAITGSTECYSPWSIEFSGYNYVKFGFVVEGECYLSTRGLKPVKLEEGDAWILIRPVNFTIATDLKLPSVSSEEVFKTPGPKHYVGKKTAQSSRTSVYGGRLDFDQLNASFVLDNLPKVIVLKAEQSSTTLKHILKVLQSEFLSTQMGSRIIIESTIQLVFIEALRNLDFKQLKGGSLKGLAHPEIGKVINEIHKDIKRDWTVTELSKIYGASRSSFAASFKMTVGVSPMDYLQRWRMIHAKEALKVGNSRISEIAYSVGYESVTAFSTAFSKVVGQSPKAFRINYTEEGAV